MVGRASGRSSVAGGIDMDTMRARLSSHSEASVAEAGDNMKVPDVGKATVCQGACCYKVVVAQSRGKPARLNWTVCERGRSAETKKDGSGGFVRTSVQGKQSRNR